MPDAPDEVGCDSDFRPYKPTSYAHGRTCAHTHTHTRIRTHAYAHTHTCAHGPACARTQIHAWTRAHSPAHTPARAYVCIHIRTRLHSTHTLPTVERPSPPRNFVPAACGVRSSRRVGPQAKPTVLLLALLRVCKPRYPQQIPRSVDLNGSCHCAHPHPIQCTPLIPLCRCKPLQPQKVSPRSLSGLTRARPAASTTWQWYVPHLPIFTHTHTHTYAPPTLSVRRRPTCWPSTLITASTSSGHPCCSTSSSCLRYGGGGVH